MRKKKKISTIKNHFKLLPHSFVDNSIQKNHSNGELMTITSNNISNAGKEDNDGNLNQVWHQLLKDLTLIGESYPEDFSLAQHRKNAWNR